MDKLENYRRIIQQLLTDYTRFKPAVGEVERYTSFDIPNDHYHLFTIGWNKHKRIYGCLIHIDIRDGKLWVQYDGTEDGIANDLVRLGVPQADIVLGFQSPYMRQFTEFAVG
jgi:hypothetical protein